MLMANRIREIRVNSGLSLKDVADKIGTSIQHLQRLEREQRTVSGEWAVKIARAYTELGIPVEAKDLSPHNPDLHWDILLYLLKEKNMHRNTTVLALKDAIEREIEKLNDPL